jgi:Zn-dependent oligopeptidase
MLTTVTVGDNGRAQLTGWWDAVELPSQFMETLLRPQDSFRFRQALENQTYARDMFEKIKEQKTYMLV